MHAGVDVAVAFTDNIDLQDNARARSGSLLELAPFVDITRDGPDSKFFLHYQLFARSYTNSNVDDQTVSHDLDARAELPLVGNWGRIAGYANAGDVRRSAFGSVASTGGQGVDNLASWRQYGLNPFARVRLGPGTRALVSYRVERTEADVADTSVTTHEVRVVGAGGLDNAALGWRVEAGADQTEQYAAGTFRSTTVETLAVFRPAAGLRIGAGANYFANDGLPNADGEHSGIGPSLRADWIPNRWQRIAMHFADTYLGSMHSLVYSARQGRWSFEADHTRKVQNTAAALGSDRRAATPSLDASDSTLPETAMATEQLRLFRPDATLINAPFSVLRRTSLGVRFTDTRTALEARAFHERETPLATSAAAAVGPGVRRRGVVTEATYRATRRFTLGAAAGATDFAALPGATEARLYTTIVSGSYTFSRALTGTVSLRHNRQSGDNAAEYDESALVLALRARF